MYTVYIFRVPNAFLIPSLSAFVAGCEDCTFSDNH